MGLNPKTNQTTARRTKTTRKGKCQGNGTGKGNGKRKGNSDFMQSSTAAEHKRKEASKDATTGGAAISDCHRDKATNTLDLIHGKYSTVKFRLLSGSTNQVATLMLVWHSSLDKLPFLLPSSTSLLHPLHLFIHHRLSLCLPLRHLHFTSSFMV